MRINIAPNRPTITTHEGAPAVHINPVQQLRRSVMANMLWEDTFYEDGVSIADRIKAEVEVLLGGATKFVGDNGPQFVADIAYEARTQMKLRHVPLLLVASLIVHDKPETRKVVADTIARVIQRPDELGELVAIYWKIKTGTSKALTEQMKKGLQIAFGKFNEYSLAKYDQSSAAVKLRDVAFLAKFDFGRTATARTIAKLTNKTYYPERTKGGFPVKEFMGEEYSKLATPDTWEVALSGGADKKETFTRLLQEEKLGALALLRNLRNMTQAGVDVKVIREGLAKMKTERVLPFRFITAAKYAPTLEPELEKVMFKCLEGHDKLGGKTVLVVDCSGSMHSPVSAKSELRRVDAAAALAMLLREICDEVQVVCFDTTAQLIPARRGFALRDLISKYGGGGTDTAKALKLAQKETYDRCIVITDEQSHTAISGPGAGKKGYFINVAAYQNGIGYKEWVHLDGWSEAIIDYILEYEKMKAGND